VNALLWHGRRSGYSIYAIRLAEYFDRFRTPAGR
jgi:hypothetical protein